MELDRSCAAPPPDVEVWLPLPLEGENPLSPLCRPQPLVAYDPLSDSTGIHNRPMPYGDKTFQMDFDFLTQRLEVTTADDRTTSIPLMPRSVADFYQETMTTLTDLRFPVSIWTTPVEVEDRTPLDQDYGHASYDPEYAQRCWRILLQAHRVLTQFRGRFLGKASPVHFFWGSFDLAASRFSGRSAPQHPGAPHLARFVAVEAYSHEVSSCGFWPGAGLGIPAFYAYAYPEPQRFRESVVFHLKPIIMRRSENLSCRMMPCGRPPCPMMRCWHLPKRSTKRQP